jgi:hypothetical protein
MQVTKITGQKGHNHGSVSEVERIEEIPLGRYDEGLEAGKGYSWIKIQNIQNMNKIMDKVNTSKRTGMI